MLLISMVGCAKDDGIIDNVISMSRIIGSMEDTPTTRSYLEDGKSVRWDNSDVIGIFSDLDELKSFSYIGENKFEGDTIRGSSFYAFYPYDAGSIFSKEGRLLCFNLDSVFFYKRNTFSRAMPMVAKSNTANMKFKQTCGLIKLSVLGSKKLSRVILRGNSDELLSGNSLFNMESDSPYLTIIDDEVASTKLTMYVNEQLSEVDPIDIYFIVPAGSYKHGITVELLETDDTDVLYRKIKTTSKRIDVQRAQSIHFSTIDSSEELQLMSISEREALMALYNATDGAHWKRNDNWGSDKPFSEWYGVRTDYYGNVWGIDLTENNLTGVIPPEFCNFKKIGYIYLAYNNLQGEIPDNIGNMGTLIQLYLYNNYITGNIPKSLLKLTALEYLNLGQNCLSGILSESVYKSDTWQNIDDININQRDGYKLTFEGYVPYESTNFSNDSIVEILQEHTMGKGIKLVITGDGYSDRLIENGTFKNDVKKAVQYFFSIEPLSSFREYFDIASISIISKNEKIGEDTAFGTQYKGEFYSTDYSLPLNNLLKSMDFVGGTTDNVTVILLLNDEGNNRVHCLMSYNGLSIGLVPNQSARMRETLIHEVAGHGFGHLADEYWERDEVYPDDRRSILESRHKDNWSLNVDYNNRSDLLSWSLLHDYPAYRYDNYGNDSIYYEGADGYSRGVFRPNDVSIMRSDDNVWFNAPSRWAIYRRLMVLSGSYKEEEEDLMFAEFLKYDSKNLFNVSAGNKTKAPAYTVIDFCASPIYSDLP